MRTRERVELGARLRALQRQRDELREARQAMLGVGAERVDGGDEHEAPGAPAGHDRRGDRGAEAVARASARRRGRGPPRSPRSARARPVRATIAVSPSLSASGTEVPTTNPPGSCSSAQRPTVQRLPALVADRRRRAHVQQPARLLGDGLEDRLGLGARSRPASRPAAARTAPRPAARAPRARPRRAPSRRGCPRARTACRRSASGARRRSARGAARRCPASSARTSVASGPVLEHPAGLHAGGHRERRVGVDRAQVRVEAADGPGGRVEQPTQRRCSQGCASSGDRR